MIKLLTLLISFNCMSLPTTEGGQKVKDPKYKHFINFNNNCSGTKVAYNKILTAAHCLGFNYKIREDKTIKVIPYYKKGDILNGERIESVELHQRYIDNVIKLLKVSRTSKEGLRLIALATKFDIGVVTLDSKPDKEKYPKVISPQSKLSSRGSIEFVNYGPHKQEFSYKYRKFLHLRQHGGATKGFNEWDTCPQTAENYKEKNLESLIEDVDNMLSMSAVIVHKVSDNEDKQEYSASSLIKGDSGSGTIEYDQDKNIVITAIASTVLSSKNNDFRPQLTIEDTMNKKSYNFKLDSLPNNWGAKDKKSLSFPYIRNKLKELKLIRAGNIKYGVKIVRQYQRTPQTNFADLLHPINQSFLQENL